MSKERIIIFDTTLRDGEQSPGMSMNMDEKIQVAEALDAMGVDVIEAGFAIASQGDFEAVHAIAKRIKNSVVCSLARAKTADIERAAEAVKPAKRSRIHTFMSTSEIHLKYQYRIDNDACLAMIRDSVTLARKFTDNVEWSAMDATRTDRDFLCRAVEEAIKCGATTVNIPDTVGYATPTDYGALIKYLVDNVPNIGKAIISTHCQNDLGLATANSLAAILNGARQIECTINGIGERAGNTSLEEVVMAIKTRADLFKFECGVNTTHIMPISKLVQNITGQSVQVNKAIVGANAFAHESGIHQDGVLKHAQTYEIMTPESVGLTTNNLVLGKHSGRHAFKNKLAQLGYTLGDNALEDAFVRFKELADKKKDIHDDDLIALVESSEREDTIKLMSLSVTCGTGMPEKATIGLQVDGKPMRAEAEGERGPVDATFQAIGKLVPHKARVKLYQVNAVTRGIDGLAEVGVTLEAPDGRIFKGFAGHNDIMVASALAYIGALCKLRPGEARKPVAKAG